MNQFDLVASPMRTAFVKGMPPGENFQPWTHLPNQVPLDQGVGGNEGKTNDSPKVKALRKAWLQKKAEIFAGKLTKPDSEDPDTVNHLNWYMSTGFTRPYPGEKTVRVPSEFNKPAPTKADDDDQDTFRPTTLSSMIGERVSCSRLDTRSPAFPEPAAQA